MTRLAEMRNDLDERALEVAWSDGSAARIPHRTLRARCPCAECRQRGRGANPVHADRGVVLIAIEPYGPNAVQLKFSDGHARGLFPFEYLRELALEAVSSCC